jgi:hypothetical protein
MGSGFLPKALLAALATIGVTKLIEGRLSKEEKATLRLPRPLVLLVLAIVSFGFLIDRVGLVLAIVAMAVLVDLAGNHAPRGGKRLLLTIVALVFFSVAVFSYVLGIPMELLPRWN